MEKKVRGDVLITWSNYIKKKWGRDGLSEALDHIHYTDKIIPGKFYPMEDYEKLLAWVKDTHGPEFIREGGAYIVSNLGFLKWVMRFASIFNLAKKIPENIGEFYSFGEGKSVVEVGKSIKLRIYDITTNRDVCEAIWGSFEGIAGLTKTKGAIKKTACRHEGAEYCEYTFTKEE